MLSLLLCLFLAVLARTHSAHGTADCSAFPGQWEGFFNWQPAGETYTLSFGATPHIIKAINNHPGASEWTNAEGTISSDNATAYLYFPEKGALPGQTYIFAAPGIRSAGSLLMQFFCDFIVDLTL